MAEKCTFDEFRNGNLCGQRLLGGVACPIHDHIRCTAAVRRNGQPEACGTRLIGGTETRCPTCRASVRLQDVLKGGV